MMSNFPKLKLASVANIKISNVDKKISTNETSVKLCNYTDVYYNWYIDNDLASNFMHASASQREIENFALQKNHVAITKDSETSLDIGTSAYIAEDLDNVLLGYHLALIEPDQKQLNGKFLNYYFHTDQLVSYFQNNTGGSGQRYSLSADTIRDIPLYIPPINEQNKIAETLGLLDTKITLNKKIDQKLDSLINMIYDYWFNQFDFPDENGKPYKSSGGAMKFSEDLQREIPNNWQTLNLEDIIAKSRTGLNPRKHFKLGIGNNYYVTIKNIDNRKIILDDKCDKIDDKALEIIQKRSDLQKGDILFTSIQPVGGTYLIQNKPINWNINESVFTIRGNYEKVTPEYLYILLSSDEMKAYSSNVSTGSIHKGIRHSDLKNFRFVYPCKTLIDQFTAAISPMLQRLSVIDEENRQLSELRDCILPILITGQVRVV